MYKVETDQKIISKAIARFQRISPYKVRRVVKQIKGRPVEEVLTILSMLKHVRGAGFLHKVVHSAYANAKHNEEFKGTLKVSHVLIDQALIMKRFQARSKGRAFPIKKRYSHIAVFLSELAGSNHKE